MCMDVYNYDINTVEKKKFCRFDGRAIEKC